MERLNLYPEMNAKIVDILRLPPQDYPMHLYAAQLIEKQSEQLAVLQAENERLKAENDKWNDADCNTCPFCTWEACDEICESRKSLTQRLADITSERDRWKARAERAEAERDAAIKDIMSVSQCETCAYAGNNPFDGSEYFRCSLGFPCVEGSGFKWRGVVEREENHE